MIILRPCKSWFRHIIESYTRVRGSLPSVGMTGFPRQTKRNEGVEVIGTILLEIAKPIHNLQLESSFREIVNIATIAVISAQCIQ